MKILNQIYKHIKRDANAKLWPLKFIIVDGYVRKAAMWGSRVATKIPNEHKIINSYHRDNKD